MRLHKRLPDGGTTLQHLQAAAVATGRVDAALLHQVPRAAAALWDAFCEIASGRQSGMGPQPVPNTEIEAWQRLSGVQLTPWEVDTIRLMDRAALAVLAEKAVPA
jgi:hypothetical protein